MYMPIKFQRVQWPVGHGGFHTGWLKCTGFNFRYFFDCGAISKEGKELIREKLAADEFDFGVISHFDRDHYSELVSAKKVKVLFLPYMTPADMVMQALFDSDVHSLTLRQAFEGFNVLQQLRKNGTRIVMVDGRGDLQGDLPLQTGPDDLLDGFSWSIPSVVNSANDKEEMRHDAAVEVRHGHKELLYFKFFNHRVDKASRVFAALLETAVNEGRLKKGKGVPYKQVADFLADVSKGNAQVVSVNGKEMQNIYRETLADPSLKASNITGSNLSSVTMYSRSIPYWYPRIDYKKVITLHALGIHRRMSSYDNGWMLTGDLELTPKTWPAFYEHYYHELSDCLVFNVPHHASKISLCDEATTFLAHQFFVMPVDAEDAKHPSNELIERLERHRVRHKQSVTIAWESAVILESFLTIR